MLPRARTPGFSRCWSKAELEQFVDSDGQTMARQVAASQQILDQGSGATASIPATSFGSATVVGTKWPLLPNQTVRIWNASIVGLPGTLGKLQLNSLSIAVVLLDASLNALNVQNIVLAGANYPSAVINGNQAGAVLTAIGDPLIELVSGFFI